MLETGMRNQENAAEAAGLSGSGKVFWNLAAPTLYERAIARGEARLSAGGALAVETGTAGDVPVFVVDDNAPDTETAFVPPAGTTGLPRAAFDPLKADMLAYAAGRTLFAQDLHAGSDTSRRVAVRVFTEHAWQALALRNLFTPAGATEIDGFVPVFTLFCLPNFKPDAERHGLEAGALVMDDPGARLLLAGGTPDLSAAIAVLRARLADRRLARGLLPLAGAASVGAQGEVALFLGPDSAMTCLDTLDPAGALLGEGALGWSAGGLFNAEGGLRLPTGVLAAGPLAALPAAGDEIARFGALFENAPLSGESRQFDLPASPESARVTLPAGWWPGLAAPGRTEAPQALFLLSRDAFGVLPPLARLTPSQALYHFLSGYSAGTEEAGTPKARFVPGLGALPAGAEPAALARKLYELVVRQGVTCWLVNTGWSGGQAGKGSRIAPEVTRRLVTAALDGSLAAAEFEADPYFGIEVPTNVEGIEPRLLLPARAWTSRMDLAMAARRLVGMFAENFARFEDLVDAEVRDAQPRLAIAAE